MLQATSIYKPRTYESKTEENPKKKLVTKNGQRYSDLLTGFTQEDRFTYHLKYLLTKGLVTKRESRYYLSAAGMRESGNFDTRTLQNVPISSPRLLLICK